MYNRAQAIVNQEAPWIFLWLPQDLYGVSRRITGQVEIRPIAGTRRRGATAVETADITRQIAGLPTQRLRQMP